MKQVINLRVEINESRCDELCKTNMHSSLLGLKNSDEITTDIEESALKKFERICIKDQLTQKEVEEYVQMFRKLFSNISN